MIFYSASARMRTSLEKKEKKGRKPGQGCNTMAAMNKKLQKLTDQGDYVVRMSRQKEERIEFIVLLRAIAMDKDALREKLKQLIFELDENVAASTLRLREISLEQLRERIDEGARQVFFPDESFSSIAKFLPERRSLDWGIDLDSSVGSAKDRLFSFSKGTDFRNCREGINADHSFDEELERIYDPHHPKSFYGIPVHYKIKAASKAAARPILDALLRALYANGRLLSRRVTEIRLEEESPYDDRRLGRYFEVSSGSTMVMELWEKESAESPLLFCGFDNRGKLFGSLIKKHAIDTQMIFLEIGEPADCSNELMSQLGKELKLIEIREGMNAMTATAYFDELVSKGGLGAYVTEKPIFEEGKFYSEGEIRSRFEQCRQTSLHEKIYKAYQNCAWAQTLPTTKGSARDELQRMIGLDRVKSIIGDIVALEKMNQLRAKMGTSENKLSKHMVFLGNPGTAKTTVARLLAEIMKEEGLLADGKFVECGRADLVGQYVGWTAVQVRQKFQQAKGGVLFIDEAYSLVEDHNSFGDEAINTIVAEMENLRDEVVVIFAGYPGKMKSFLEKNEGLKSRITYHVDFPDYTPEELMQIMEKQTADRGFTLTEDAKVKCEEIFNQVYREPDYGNGRFVRNLLEQGILKQASRVGGLGTETLDRETLFTLTGEDFVQREVRKEEKKALIGFTA